MAVVDITVANTLSGAGNINDDYFISNSANLIIDQNFSCKSMTIGKNSTGTESKGLLDLRAFTLTFGTGIAEFGITAHIKLYPNASEVRHAITTPPDAENPATFTRDINDFLTIVNKGGNSLWSALYYILIRPTPLISIYSSTATPTVNNRVKLPDFGEVVEVTTKPRKPRFNIQARRGNTSRTEHIGYGPKEYTYNYLIDVDDFDGVLKNIENLLTTFNQTYFLVTDREVLIDYFFSGFSGPGRAWKKEISRVAVGLSFREKVD